MDGKTCGNCRWWVFAGHTASDGYLAGECERNAPMNVIPQGFAHAGQGVWPYVSARDFCGEHQPKENTNEAE